MTTRWRLQLLAELSVGSQIRQQQAIEGQKLARMKQRAK